MLAVFGILFAVLLGIPDVRAQTLGTTPLGSGGGNCVQAGGYPFTQGGCLNAADINNALALSIGNTPPRNAYNQGAGQGKLWLDTSVTPSRLRQCNVTTCSPSYTFNQWIEWAAVENAAVDWPIGGGVVSVNSSGVVDLNLYPQAVLEVSGSARISSFGTALPAGRVKVLLFSGTPTIAYSPTAITNPTGADIAVQSGSLALAVSQGGGLYNVLYQGPGGTTSPPPPTPFPSSVPNTAALQALTGMSAGSVIYRAGSAAAGDGGAASYTYSTSSCTAADNGAQVTSTAGGGCWKINAQASYDVPIWGVFGDGTTDGTTGMQAAVNAQTGGGTLRFPSGTYKLHDITGTVGGLHIVGSGATIDCSAMTDHCIQIRPATVPSATRLLSGSIEGLRFIHSNTTGRVIDIEQVFNPYIQNVVMADVQPGATAIRLYGVQNPDLRNIDGNGIQQVINGVNGTFIEFSGDLTGKSSTGAACSLGDCSTRSDLLVINNVRGGGANASAVALYWHDQAFTVQANDFQFENGLTGIMVRCAVGQPNIGSCPAVFLGKGVNLEFGTNPVDLQDFTDFRCVGCYFAGQNNTINHVITDTLVNYPQVAGAGGGFQLTDATIWNAGGSCVYLAVSDTKIAGSRINICNGSSIGAAGVEYGAAARHNLADTNLCTVLGSNPGTMAGVIVDSAASNVDVHDSKFFGCAGAGRIGNASSLPFSVLDRGNQGPGGSPTIAAGTCGTSPSITGIDESFQVVIGTGTVSSCQVNFGTPQIRTPNCGFSIASGTTGPTSITASGTSVIFNGTSMAGRFQTVCST